MRNENKGICLVLCEEDYDMLLASLFNYKYMLGENYQACVKSGDIKMAEFYTVRDQKVRALENRLSHFLSFMKKY